MPLLRFDSHQCVTQRGHTAIASSIATNGATVYTGGASAVPTVCVLLGPAGGRARDSLAPAIHGRLPRGPAAAAGGARAPRASPAARPPARAQRSVGRRAPIARGGVAWYIVVVYPAGAVPEGGAQRDQGHRRARRVLRERAQALQEAVREGRAPVGVQEAPALREAERPAEAQSPRCPQEGQAAGTGVRLASAALPGRPPELPSPGRERVRRRVEAGHIRERGTEWDAVRALLAHEAQTAMGRERAAGAEPLSDPGALLHNI